LEFDMDRKPRRRSGLGKIAIARIEADHRAAPHRLASIGKPALQPISRTVMPFQILQQVSETATQNQVITESVEAPSSAGQVDVMKPLPCGDAALDVCRASDRVTATTFAPTSAPMCRRNRSAAGVVWCLIAE
jgi:hypothetical protein